MADLTKIRLSGVTYDLTDSNALHTLDQNVTSGGTNAVQGSGIYNAITASSEAILTTVANAHYQTSGDVQSAISGKVNTSTFNTYTSTTVPNLLADKADASALTAYFGAVNYDSNTKRINFYNETTGGTVLAYVDATDFIKDGMVDNVEIKTVSGETVLAITFNADAGKEEIDIPLTNIFNPNNYYDKTAIDTALSGKQDTLIEGSGIEIDAQNNIKAVYTLEGIDEAAGGSIDMFENELSDVAAETVFWVVAPFDFGDGILGDPAYFTIYPNGEEAEEPAFTVSLDTINDTIEVTDDNDTGADWNDYFTISHNGAYYVVEALQALSHIGNCDKARLVGDSSYIFETETTTKAALDYLVAEALNLEIRKQNKLSAGSGIAISNDTISVTASTTVDQTIISGSTNAVAGGAVYNALEGKNPMISVSGTTLIIS